MIKPNKVSESIEQSKSIALNGSKAQLNDYSYFAEPLEDRAETQLTIFGKQFSFRELDTASLFEFNEQKQVWGVGADTIELGF